MIFSIVPLFPPKVNAQAALFRGEHMPDVVPRKPAAAVEVLRVCGVVRFPRDSGKSGPAAGPGEKGVDRNTNP